MKRPTFLTVLCILTFVWSGYTIITSVFSFATTNLSTNIIKENKMAMDTLQMQLNENLGNNVENKKPMEFASKMLDRVANDMTPEKLRKNIWAQLFGTLFCLGGALLMWKLKKPGYYVYIIGSLIGLIAPFLIFGTGSIIALISTSFAAFAGILFCILYGLNFKHLQ